MELVALVTVLIILEYFVFTMLVGAARGKSKIQPPVMTGDPRLERALRVQGNTLEQLAVVLPSMWLFAMYQSEMWAAILGFVFFLGRALYAKQYMADPATRAPGFIMGMLATTIMLLGSLYAIVMKLL